MSMISQEQLAAMNKTALGREPMAARLAIQPKPGMVNNQRYLGGSPGFYDQPYIGDMRGGMGYGVNFGMGRGERTPPTSSPEQMQQMQGMQPYFTSGGLAQLPQVIHDAAAERRYMMEEQRRQKEAMQRQNYFNQPGLRRDAGPQGRPPGRPMRGPDEMGMPQAYPDRIEDPTRNRGRGRDRERGQLTRLSPGVYRNERGDLVNSRGGMLPNQPGRDRQRDARREVESGFSGMRPPNGKGPAATEGLGGPTGGGYQAPYDFNQAQNPIYRFPQGSNQQFNPSLYNDMTNLPLQIDQRMNPDLISQLQQQPQNPMYQMPQQQQQPYFTGGMFDRFMRR